MAPPLQEGSQSELGKSQGGSQWTGMRAKPQRNPVYAVVDAQAPHALGGERITKISLFFEGDQGDAVMPAEPTKIGPDLALAEGLKQAIASEVENA